MASKSDTWMPLYIADYLRKTMHLNRDQHGGYMLLLMACWDRGGRLPNDPGQLAGIVRATPAEWRKLAPVLLPYFEVDGDHLIQSRVIEEHEKAVRLSEARRLAGKQGGRPKKGGGESKLGSEQKAIGFAKPKQTETHAGVRSSQSPPSDEGFEDANASLSPEGDEPSKYPEDFEACWKAYPHIRGRSSKRKAWGCWRRITAGRRALLPSAIARYAREGREPKEDCGAPAMDRWLRDERYLDWMTAGPADAAPALVWLGPPDLLDDIRKAMPSADAFLRLTRWDVGRHAIVTTSGTASDRLKREAGHVLRAAKVEIILEQAA